MVARPPSGTRLLTVQRELAQNTHSASRSLAKTALNTAPSPIRWRTGVREKIDHFSAPCCPPSHPPLRKCPALRVLFPPSFSSHPRLRQPLRFHLLLARSNSSFPWVTPVLCLQNTVSSLPPSVQEVVTFSCGCLTLSCLVSPSFQHLCKLNSLIILIAVLTKTHAQPKS